MSNVSETRNPRKIKQAENPELTLRTFIKTTFYTSKRIYHITWIKLSFNSPIKNAAIDDVDKAY